MVLKRRLSLPLAALAVAGVLLGIACGDDGGDNGADPTSVETLGGTPPPDATSAPGTPTPTASEADKDLEPVRLAVEDLATRFERSPDEIEVVSVVPRQWPDACLDVTYLQDQNEVCAQVITPGYEVTLRLEPNLYYYHTDESGQNVRFAGLDIAR
jgi:hypothetical protein